MTPHRSYPLSNYADGLSAAASSTFSRSKPMPFAAIQKTFGTGFVAPNMVNYDKARTELAWDAIRGEMQGLPAGAGLNIAHEAVDRHATGARAQHAALRWIAKEGTVRVFTFAEMARGSARFANVLRSLGVTKGDRVFALMGRIPELYLAALGTLKNTSVFCPLFSQFGPERVMLSTTSLVAKNTTSLRLRFHPSACTISVKPLRSRI